MGNWGDLPPRLNTRWRPIVNQYREGKVKRTPARGVKQYLKPYAYKQSKPRFGGVTACLLHNEPASYFQQQGEPKGSRSESESEQGVQLLGVDAKRSDLSLARAKAG